MFKVKYKLCPEITSDTFMERTNSQYNSRNRPDFITPQVNSVFYGTKSIHIFFYIYRAHIHVLEVKSTITRCVNCFAPGISTSKNLLKKLRV